MGPSSACEEIRALLLLGPEHEPPPAFEARVLRSLRPRPERRRWLPRLVPVVAAALVAAVLTAGGLYAAFRDDRRIAEHYRATLAQADGSYFGAVRLHDAAGADGGVVFTYRGSPSWMMVTVAAPHRASVARAVVYARGGRRVPLDGFRLAGGAWGGALPVDQPELVAVHLLDRSGRPVLVATVPQGRERPWPGP
jgi:hypothetical protein